MCYAAAEARLSFYYNADSGTLALATMTAAPVNLPPGNDDPIGIPFSAGSTNVTLTDKEARVLIENKQNLDRFNASLAVIALVKNDISDARSRWLEIKCGSMSLVPNFTQVFTCRLSGL
ncbi:unnamed protein product [Cuscuta epithymum]|uniref:Uncharacterized protein n=1 Tax=Cuscuta epithymum TaxID=186058 RepID=A0AAV0F302_9ASTE|nr:unnamed protein product [Cuscuta epithymum]